MKRDSIKEDVLFFLLPAALIYVAGLLVSGWAWVKQGPLAGQATLFTPSVQSIAGLALICFGLGLLFVAAGTLRRSYSSTLVVREGHELVTHGVYRHIRHPIYLGALMVCLGIPVYTSSLPGLLIMSLLIPLILNRIRIEERMLVEHFGKEYRAYQTATRTLIPFVY
jgi:protein-S-isoprenylcysteine O-methyltransferase Ste14